jgi:hypothetical protein
MFFYTQTRRCIAWMVLAVMLFASLSPSLANAFAFSFASTFPSAAIKGPLGEICMAKPGGSSRLQIISDQTEQGPGKHLHPLAHCVLCSLHSDAIDLPPPHKGLSLPALIRAGKPSLFYTTPGPHHAWTSPQSRAPPSA